MADYSALDPTDDANWAAWQAYRQSAQTLADQNAASDNATAKTAAALISYYPNMQPGTVMALAQGGILPGSDLAEQANSASGAVQKAQSSNKSWFHDLFNSTIRAGMTGASFVGQELTGVARTEAHNLQHYGVAGSILAPFESGDNNAAAVEKQTDLGQIIDTAEQGKSVQTGSGFFVNPDSAIGQGQSQAARDAWTVDGHAATIGRVLAGVVSEPDTEAYNLISGTIDFANAWKLDPTNVYGGELAKLNKAKKVFASRDAGVLPTIPLSPEINGKQLTLGGVVNQASLGRKVYDTSSLADGETINDAGRIIDATGKDLGAATLTDAPVRDIKYDESMLTDGQYIDDAGRIIDEDGKDIGAAKLDTSPEVTGLLDTDYKAVAKVIANQWLESRPGRFVSERVAEMDSPTDIRNAMNKKIDIETATSLADAKTPEDVQSIIRNAAVNNQLREKPYTGGFSYWKPTQNLGYQVKRSLESVRLLQAMPGDHFNLSDPTQAVDQLDRTLKNAAFDPKQSRPWTDQLARATSNEERRTIIFNAMGAIASKLKGETLDFSDWTPDEIKNFGDSNIDTLKIGDFARPLDQSEYGTIASRSKKMNTVTMQYADGSKASYPSHMILKHDDVLAGNVVDNMVRLYRNTTRNAASYAIDDAGKEVGVEGLTINKNGIPIPQPLLFSQLANESLPGLSRDQILAIRRSTAFGKPVLTSGAYGYAADKARILQSTWRNFALLRGAYTLRVVGEEQLRMAANDLDSLLSHHPLSALAMVVGDHNPKFANWIPKVGGKEIPISEWLDHQKLTRGARMGNDAWGQSFTQAAEDEGVNSDFMGAQMRLHGDQRWAKNTTYNGWVPTPKGSEHYVPGWSMELGQLHADPLAKRLAGGWVQADGIKRSGNDVLDAKEWWWNGGGRKYRMEMSKRGGQWANMAEDRALSDRYVEAIDGIVQHKTSNDPELRALIGSGTVKDKKGVFAPASKRSVADLLTGKAERGQGPEMVRAHIEDAKRVHRDSAVDHFFDILISRPSNALSRSPAFRQYYWDRMAELMPSLNPKDQATVMENAAKANLDGRWLRNLQDGLKRGSSDQNLADIDLMAKSHALDTTKKLLYDLGDRSQFFDQLKIVMPFGEAWKEALTTYAKAFRTSPHEMYRLGQTVEGGEGSGFFYKDPSSGQMVFNYPLSAQINQMVTGTYTPFKGSVSGLNLAGNGLPGMGPVIQIAMSKLVADKPYVPDWFQQWILPTGEPDYGNGFIEAWFPGWMKRGYTAVFNAKDSNKEFGTTAARIAAYKMTTGHYDISTEAGMDQLNRDSMRSARAMFVMRALAQFVAPTAPSPEWMAKDKDGHVTTAALLMQDYRNMQQDPNIGYQNADGAFLQKYGENALLYMQPLSKGGFSPTTQLHTWVQQHPDIASKYGDVYGYFAGQGGEYSNHDFERQLAMGERTQLSGKDILRLANERVARLQYQQAKTLVGDKPNAAGREFLQSMQAELQTRYPGYNPDYNSGDPSRADKIAEIQRALSNEPQLSKSDVGKTAIDYLQLRDAVLQEVPNFQQSKAGAGAREALRQYGTALVAANPQFAQMWELLDGEMKDDATTNTSQA